MGEPLDIPKIISVTQLNNKLEIKWGQVFDAEEYKLEISKIKSILPIRIEKETIERITDTTCVVEDLNCKQCIVKVKAKNQYVSSEWSEQIKITMDSNEVSTIMNDQSETEYYTIDGLKCMRVPKKGLHMMRQNGKYKKIFRR